MPEGIKFVLSKTLMELGTAAISQSPRFLLWPAFFSLLPSPSSLFKSAGHLNSGSSNGLPSKAAFLSIAGNKHACVCIREYPRVD